MRQKNINLEKNIEIETSRFFLANSPHEKKSPKWITWMQSFISGENLVINVNSDGYIFK